MNEYQEDYFKLTYDHLRLIAKDIFSDSPAVAIRELIQNAHDAILLRAAQERDNPRWAVRISINNRGDDKTITITDDGIGMTLDDIKNHLTVLGSSDKTNIMEDPRYKNIREPNKEKLENVIGTFGFGFVASFIISDKIEIWTKSIKPNAKGIFCRFGRKKTYEYKEEEITNPGTKIVLRIDKKTMEQRKIGKETYLGDTSKILEEGNILDVDTIQAIVQKYCDLLQYDIWVGIEGGKEFIANIKQAPWEDDPFPSSQQYNTFFKRRVGQDVNEPLFHIPFFATREEDKIKATGVFYVPDPFARTREEMGFLDIFIKRMWVSEGETEILPCYAKFLKGVIMSPDLVPRMDRCSLDPTHQSYHHLKRAIDKKVYEYFKDLCINKVETFRKFLDSYGEWFKRDLVVEWRATETKGEDFPYIDLLRNIPFKAYSQKHMGGKLTTLNSYIGIDPQIPITKIGKEKHQIYAVGKMIRPDQQGEFRKLIAQKSYSVIVPESITDLALITVITDVFKRYIMVIDIEPNLLKDFIDILKRGEKEKWNLFIEYFKARAEVPPKLDAEVEVGNITNTIIPAIITDIPIEEDDDEEEIKEKIETPNLDSLEKVFEEGFRKAIIINAQSPFMKNLLTYCEDNKLDRLDNFAELCLHQCFNMAAQEHLSGSLPFEILRYHFDTQLVFMENSLKIQRDFYKKQKESDIRLIEFDEKEKEIKKYKDIFGEVDIESPIIIPEKPEPRWAAIIITDIDSSTTTLSNIDFKDQGYIFSQYIDELKNHIIKSGGFFDKFTGDGFVAFLGVDKSRDSNSPEIRKFCKDAELCAENIASITNKFCERKDIKKILEEEGLKAFRCRTAVAYGKISFGKFGGFGSAVGKAIVEAARMCEKKDYFETYKLVVSEDFLGSLGVVSGNKYKSIEKGFLPRGLSREIEVFGCI